MLYFGTERLLNPIGPPSAPNAGPSADPVRERPPVVEGRAASGPPQGPAIPPLGRCPRCGAAVTGAYKFCPACAFRLRTDIGAEEPPVTAGRRWRARILGGALVGAFLGAGLVGVLLFQRPTGDPVVTPPLTPVTYDRPVFLVSDIPDELVQLPQDGEAGTVHSESFSAALDPELRDQFPVLKVVILYALRVMKYEVTQGQYAEFVRDLEAHPDAVPTSDRWHYPLDWPSDPASRPRVVDLHAHVPRAWLRDEKNPEAGWSLEESGSSPNLPVSDVTYEDAAEFARWASHRLGLELRLPVYPEWSRAARGGSAEARWPWGNDPYEYGRYASNHAGIWTVGTGRPNPVHFRYEPLDGPHEGGRTGEGLYSMAGNVAEWTQLVRLVLATPGVTDTAPKVSWVDAMRTDPDYGEFAWYAYAAGGSFRSGIDDCTADSMESLPRAARRPDIGFRLVTVER